MNPSVLKFGGSSVATTERIMQIASVLSHRIHKGEKMVIVVSAMGKTTNQLIALAKEIHPRHPHKKALDHLLATGEQQTVALMTMALASHGITCEPLTGFQAGITTDDFYTKARIKKIHVEKLKSLFDHNQVLVIAGFQGMTENGAITTLGRGGSDTTAVALAAALQSTCEIYTDVDGIYTLDPRIHPQAKMIQQISYDEMLELSSTGAGVMETRAIEMGHKNNVPIYVAHAAMTRSGTLIKEKDITMETQAVTGLALQENCFMTTITHMPFNHQLVSKCFSELADAGILVDMISQTGPYDGNMSLSFTTLADDAEAVMTHVQKLFSPYKETHISHTKDITKLSVVGVGMVTQTGVAAKLFALLDQLNIPFHQVTTSEISISYTLPLSEAKRAAIHIAELFSL